MARKKLTEKEMIEQAWELRKKFSELLVKELRTDFEAECDYIDFDEEEKRYADIGLKRQEIGKQIKKLTKKAQKKGYQEVLTVLQPIAVKEKKGKKMNILKKICGILLAFLLPEKIPEFAASMYINLARRARTRFYQEVAKEIIERMDMRNDVWNLLDIGTGPGFMLFEIAEMEPYLEMIGIDLSEKLIEFAKREAEKRIYGNIYFEIGDANNLRFEDSSCDFVISSGVLHSLRHPDKAIREWLRVLKPGHYLWIYDPTVLVGDEDAKDKCRLKKILDDMEKCSASRKDRFLFRLMWWISNLPPKPMSLDRIYEIVQEAGIVDSVAVEDRGSYIKIAIVKK